jgi:exosortase H (IPTLxxWG-CTERM-specific)
MQVALAHRPDHSHLPEENPSLPPQVWAFALLCALLFALCNLVPDQAFEPLNRLVARLAGLLLAFFGVHASVQGVELTVGGFRVAVITECSGLYLWILFLSFVACVPSSRYSRLVAGVAGSCFLGAANVARIALVSGVAARQPRLFPYLHVYLMQVVMVLLLAVCCLVWLRWSRPSRVAGAPLDFLLRFILCGTILFVLWLPVHRRYVEAIDRLVVGLFSLFDIVLVIPELPVIYHHTLSLVLFAALVISTSGTTALRKAGAIAGGALVLAGVHLLFRVSHVLLTAFGKDAILPLHVSIHLINQYLLPVLLWLGVLLRADRLGRRVS